MAESGGHGLGGPGADNAVGRLRDDAQLYRTLVAAMEDGFCIAERVPGDPVDFRYVATNPAFSRLTCVSDPIGRTMRDIVPDADEASLACYDRVLTTGMAERFTAYGLGSEFHVEALATDMPGQIAILFRDVSATNGAERALRESEERHAFLLTLSDVMRPLTDVGEIERTATRLLGEHLRADRCFLSHVTDDGSGMYVREEYLRADASSVLGDYTFAQFGDFVGPELHAGRILAIEDVSALAGLGRVERESYAKVEIGAYLLIPLVRDNRLAAFLTINHRTPRTWSDADKAIAQQTADRLWTARERGRVETALRASEERQRMMIELVPVLLWEADPRGNFITLTDRWRGYTGQTEAETLDFGWLAAIHPDDLTATRAAFEHAFATGEPLEHEHRIMHAGDGYRWHALRHVPVRDAAGSVVRWYGAAVDVHQLRMLQERQETLVAELQHRVRNILAVIRSIMRRSLDGQQSLQDYAQHLEGRMSALARAQVLLTRRIDARVDLEELVRDELTAQAADDARVTIAGPDVALAPKAAEVLALAMHELATNSLKYGAIGSTTATVAIDWRVEPRGDVPWLVVTWRERGVDFEPGGARRAGFGTELVTRRVPYELRGEGTITIEPGGAVCRMAFPLSDGSSILETGNDGRDDEEPLR